MIRVRVAARSPIVRAGLEAVIREAEGLELSEAAADVAVVVVEEEELPADAAGEAAVVLLAPEPQAAFVAEALHAGVRAVLPADSAPAAIAAAIGAAAAGLVVVTPADLPALAAAPAMRGDQPLTAREVEVLRLMADGEANKGIAWKLGISEHTVKFHVASIMSKLGAGSRTEAVRLGIRRGLVPL